MSMKRAVFFLYQLCKLYLRWLLSLYIIEKSLKKGCREGRYLLLVAKRAQVADRCSLTAFDAANFRPEPPCQLIFIRKPCILYKLIQLFTDNTAIFMQNTSITHNTVTIFMPNTNIVFLWHAQRTKQTQSFLHMNFSTAKVLAQKFPSSKYFIDFHSCSGHVIQQQVSILTKSFTVETRTVIAEHNSHFTPPG